MAQRSKLKGKVKHAVSHPVIITVVLKFPFQRVLLRFPFLYRTRLVKYETALRSDIDELLAQLGVVITLDGSIIECGSMFCGTSVIMADYLRSNCVHKVVYACDSFEGFDRAELDKERQAGLVKASDKAFTFTSHKYVRRKIKRLGFEGVVVPVKGFFEQTLPTIKGEFCFALIDCDLGDSTVYCMETIWPNLVSGGRMVIDDYADDDWKGIKLGVDFFVDKYQDEISAHGLLGRLYFVCKS